MWAIQRWWLLPLVLLGVWSGASCADLPPIEPDVCGNGFVDLNEDCDDHVQIDGKTDCSKDKRTCRCRQSGEVDACRWYCAPAIPAIPATPATPESPAIPEIKCPVESKEGWGCGIDHVCRRPMRCDGKPCPIFSEASVVPQSAIDLKIADFYGGGRGSVLSVAPPLVSLHTFDPDGRVSETNSLVAPQASPSIGDLTSAEPTKAVKAGVDFAIDASHGIEVIHNVSGAPFEPIVYASISAMTTGQVAAITFASPEPVPPVFVIFPDAASQSTKINVIGAAKLGLKETDPLVTLDKPLGTTGNVVVQGFTPKLFTPCQDFAVAQAGASDVEVHVPCRVDLTKMPPVVMNVEGKPGYMLPRKIGLPAGIQVCQDCQALFAVDVDRDGFVDLVISGKDTQSMGNPGVIAVAYNRGDGSFNSSSDKVMAANNMAGVLDVKSAGLLNGQAISHLHDAPLAVGDVNEDCALDYVTGYGLYVSVKGASTDCLKPLGYTTLAPFEDEHDWTSAAIADMTGDGYQDVIAGSKSHAGITFYKSTGTEVLNPFALVTTGSVKDFAIGDFDGDVLSDLAFTQIGDLDSNGTRVDTLGVVFGSASGGPTQPVEFGKIDTIEQIHPSNVLLLAPDLMTDLFVVSRNPEDSSRRDIALFPGNSDRQLVAPFYLLDVNESIPDFPQQSTIGQFNDDPHNDIVVFARHLGPLDMMTRVNLWLLPSTGKAEITPNSGISTQLQGFELANPKEGLLLASVNLDAPSAQEVDRDEVVLVGHLGPMDPKVPRDASLFVARVSGGKFTFDKPPIVLDKLGKAGLEDLRIFIADADGDQKRDVVVSSPDGVIVFFNQGAGMLDMGHTATISAQDIYATPCAATGSSTENYNIGVRGVGALNMDSDAAMELVVVTDQAGYILDYDGTGFVPSCRADIPAGKAVAVGDVNGDGVDDVVVAQKSGIHVLLGTPADPGNPAPDAGAAAGAMGTP